MNQAIICITRHATSSVQGIPPNSSRCMKQQELSKLNTSSNFVLQPSSLPLLHSHINHTSIHQFHQPQFIDSTTTPPLSLQSGITDQPAPTFYPKRTITHHLTIHRHDATQSPSSQPYGSLSNSKPRRHFQ